MDAEIKRKWVEALRSGKYRQGTRALRHGDLFCCLGVLCDVLHPDEWRDGGEHQGHVSLPSVRIRSKASLGTEQAEELADRNDGGASFSEIADYIEENL